MSRALFLLPLALLLACGDKADEDEDGPVDADGDGFDEDADCDDSNDTINPDADELCDGVDNNCDGETDEDTAVDALTWFADTDGDGFGDAESSSAACEQPADSTDDDTDCDDGDAAVHPDADELCATVGVDDDCDGEIDEDDAADAATWYRDGDGDEYGDADSSKESCEQPDGYVDNGDDCVDDESSISPMAAEVCDGIDNNCDGEVDEDSAVDAPTWYTDADHDGYGDDSTGAPSCEPVEWQTDDDTDCDDTNPTVYPDAPAICDDLDNNCDGTVDGGWRVPTDYADIQTAIDAAAGGETICVEAGTYTENIDFGAVDVALIGTDGAESTTIDGGAAGSVVTIEGGQSSDAVLQGFTLTNGSSEEGAGVYISESSPTLVDLIVSGNSISSEDRCYGTGIYVIDGDPILEMVDIVDNSAECDVFYGVGMYMSGTLGEVANLHVAGNSGTAESYCYGSGLNIRNDSVLTASNTEVLANTCVGYSAQGTGIYVYYDTVIDFENLVVAGNDAESESSAYAVGLYANNDCDVSVTNASIHGNSATAEGTVYGVGVDTLNDSEVGLINVVVSDNTASAETIDGTGVSATDGVVTLSYCDVYNNDTDFYGIDDPTGTDGNISTDPGYTDVSSADPLDWDFTLDSASSLIDAGDPSIDDPDGSTSDIGAYGGEGAADWGWSATIEELRDGTVPEGYVVTVSEVVVTGVSDAGFTVQDPNATGPEYSGIYVYLGETPPNVARGMEVSLEGELYEYFGLAELLVEVEDIVVTGTPGELTPTEISVSEANDEAWEGVLVTITDGSLDDAAYDCSVDNSYCSDSDLWTLTDGSDTLIIYDRLYESDDWADQIGVSPVTGVMSYNYDRYRLMPRSSWDF